MKPFRLLLISDTHTGSRLGLTPKEWIQPDTAMVLRPMWDWFVKTTSDIGRVDLTVGVGDMVDGLGKQNDLELLIPDTGKQAEVAVEALEHIDSKAWRFVYGTPFHTVGSSNFEEPIADAMGASIKETQLLNVYGHNFNFRHVVGRSDTAYAQGTQVFKEAVRDQLISELEDREAADVVVRGHVHYYYRVENSRHIALVCPCFQVPASVFGRKMKHFLYDLGLILIEITKEEINIHPPLIMPLKIVVEREYEKIG